MGHLLLYIWLYIGLVHSYQYSTTLWVDDVYVWVTTAAGSKS